MSTSLERLAARAAAFVIEPGEAPLLSAERPPGPLVAVCALAPRAGATTIARGLGAALAAIHPAGAASVPGQRPSGRRLGSPAARRLAAETGAHAVAGRLCIPAWEGSWEELRGAARMAPVVADLGVGGIEQAAALADHVVIAAGPGSGPALVEVAAMCAVRAGLAPQVVWNRAAPAHGSPEHPPWVGAPLRAPSSPVGAALARSGVVPPGPLGAILRELAERCREVR